MYSINNKPLTSAQRNNMQQTFINLFAGTIKEDAIDFQEFKHTETKRKNIIDNKSRLEEATMRLLQNK